LYGVDGRVAANGMGNVRRLFVPSTPDIVGEGIAFLGDGQRSRSQQAFKMAIGEEIHVDAGASKYIF